VPRYFFTVRGMSRDLEADPIGMVLPDIRAALAHAQDLIEELKRRHDAADTTLMMVVKDAAQQTVLYVPFFVAGD
jgi:Domain of unknown function (DUF6894)